jgi:hypothetical protein
MKKMLLVLTLLVLVMGIASPQQTSLDAVEKIGICT